MNWSLWVVRISWQPMTDSNVPTVCILYGFCEGGHTGLPLVCLLRERGYAITGSPSHADIVVGHSGGCFIVPEHATVKQYIMVGLPYWPGKSVFRALVEKNRLELRQYYGERRLGEWLRKFSWNLIYFWKVPSNIRMLRAQRNGRFWHTKHVVLVRNRQDRCCTPDITALSFANSAAFIELPGQHDDIWQHPEYYVDIINHYASRLLA